MTRSRVRLVAVATLLAFAPSARAAEPEPPVAPSPDAPAAQVQPAAFLDPAASAARHGGLPLTVDPAAAAGAGRKSVVSPPLSDWRLLAAVAAAFAVLAAVRARSGRGQARLPTDVFAVLGEAALGGGQAVRVVRFGPKTLLIGVSSAGPRTLAEIADPQATDCIVAACRGAQASRGGLRPKPSAGPRPAPVANAAGEAA